MKIAFVVQRYGSEVNGGAELLCRRLAERFSSLWDIDVLTTCAQDYMTWQDEYQGGVSRLNGVTLKRFPVTFKRNPWLFSRCYDFVAMTEQARLRGRGWRLLHKIYQKTGFQWLVERVWMLLQGPYSLSLQSYIRKHEKEYDIFVFFTYTYATTWYSLPAVRHKSIVLPMAHDDVAYRLNVYDQTFQDTENFIFLTPEEKILVEQRVCLTQKRDVIASLGTEIPEDADGKRFRSQTGILASFVLYVGRVEEQKGCPDMVHHFVEYKKKYPSDLKLVVIGKEFWSLPKFEDIIPLGFVDEQCKIDAMAAAEILIMPSAFESLSIVLLEAWSVKTPCLVTRACEVLVGQCERSQGGMVYDTTESFINHLHHLLCSPEEVKLLGENGYRYVQQHYVWEQIEASWDSLVCEVVQGNRNYQGEKITSVSPKVRPT
ncbi:MAG: glycosyltransferase family 4 protein [Oligoflexales bacterium]